MTRIRKSSVGGPGNRPARPGQKTAAPKGRRSAADFLPADRGDLSRLRDAASRCEGCDLFRNATQTVFGQGNPRARIMLVGEQPGDHEDRQGEPFVGPAGKLLYRLIDEVGLDRAELYVTNAVKHFNFEQDAAHGQRRLHKKPRRSDVVACAPWLQCEIEAVKPEILVCLGATAAQALLGAAFRVTEQRGVPVPSPLARHVLATVHPSALLRAPDDRRDEEIARFKADLAAVKKLLDR